MTEPKTDRIPKGYEEAAALAAAYFAAHERLRERVEEIKERQRAAGRRLLPGLKRMVAEASAARDALRQHIASRPGAWDKPRTRGLHGVKLGMRTLPGRLSIDAAAAIPLIRQHLPGQSKTLIKVTETLNANAVKALKAAQLARIGGAIEEQGDEVVISIPRSAVDKLVEALLDDLDEPEPEGGREP